MPAPRLKSRNRRGYHDGHFAQLAFGHDWFGGWGHLEQLDSETLAETVADMVRCWEQHQSEINAECAPHQPWFAEYAADTSRLIRESTMHREYMKAQHDRGGYFPREEFEAEFEKSHLPTADAAATGA